MYIIFILMCLFPHISSCKNIFEETSEYTGGRVERNGGRPEARVPPSNLPTLSF